MAFAMSPVQNNDKYIFKAGNAWHDRAVIFCICTKIVASCTVVDGVML